MMAHACHSSYTGVINKRNTTWAETQDPIKKKKKQKTEKSLEM
jgi:hypothetical protein